jgi:tetratricopeptide (TPR) repeat protein
MTIRRCSYRYLLIALFLVQGAAAAQTTARLQAEKLFVEAQKSLSRGDTESAESLLMKALQKDSGFTSAIWQLAQIYESRGQLAHARELILRGLTLEPEATWAREKLTQLEKALTGKLLQEAESLMREGQYNLAIPKLSLYLGIKPYDPAPLIRLGRCHLALGNIETAKEYLVQAFERDPTNSQVTALLAEIDDRIEQESVSALIARARKIIADYGPDRETEARDALQAILSKKPDNRWAREKMHEIELLSAERDRPEESDDEKQTTAMGTEKMKSIRERLSRAWRIIADRLLVILIAAAVALLALNIKRRFERRTYPLQGSLSLVPILDIVSLLNGNLKTGRLILTCNESRGELFFDKGEIVHARWKQHDGRKAFHAILDQTMGRYMFINRLPNIKRTISEPLSLLLLSKKSDEELSRSHGESTDKRRPVTTAP